MHQIKVADQFKGLFDPRKPMSEATGSAMAEWAKGQGDAQREKETMDLARDRARDGTAAFTAWWTTDQGKAARPLVKPIMEEIKALCGVADEMAAMSDDEPFGRSVADHGEANATDADALIAQFNAARDEATYDGAKKAYAVLGVSLTDDERVDVDAAQAEASERVLA